LYVYIDAGCQAILNLLHLISLRITENDYKSLDSLYNFVYSVVSISR
jgi:hypothetical protein